MSTREHYRQFARECLRLAAEAKDDTRRKIFLEMADAWTVIAFEVLEASRPPSLEFH